MSYDINNFIDMTFVLRTPNTEQKQIRLNSINKTLKSLYLEKKITFIDGGKYRQLEIPSWFDACRRDRRLGVFDATMNYVDIIKEGIAKKYKTIAIFEDDAAIMTEVNANDINNFYEWLANNSWDIIYPYRSKRVKIIKDTGYCSYIQGQLNMTCWIIRLDNKVSYKAGEPYPTTGATDTIDYTVGDLLSYRLNPLTTRNRKRGCICDVVLWKECRDMNIVAWNKPLLNQAFKSTISR